MKARSEHGYIALITVLIIGAVSTAIATGLLLLGADAQRGSVTGQGSIQARGLAMACTDEALQQLHNNTFYIGSGNLTLGQGTCSYSVTNNSGNRLITVSGTVNGVVRRVQVYVTIGSSSISITSWQETST